MITVNITGTDQVRATFSRLSDIMQRQAIAATAVKVEEYAEQQASRHSKTGALVGSLKKARLPNGSWEVYHDPRMAPHAMFVHWGTKPHTIKPKNKKMLRWANGGRFHFAKAVQHPGTKADPWFTRAAAMVPAIFRAEVDKRIAKL